jgi:hypothetical protein
MTIDRVMLADAYQCLLVLALTVPVPGATATPQESAGPADSEQQTRQLWDDAFRRKRAESTRPSAGTTVPAPVRPSGARTESTGPAESLGDSLVGVTVWRLRPLTPGDASKGAIVFSGSAEEFTAERIEVDSPLSPGDRIRIGIEAGRTAYLYLIDREQYADGSFGDPYLIFPRSRIREGNNKVMAGRLVEIPDLADTPPFFTMKASRTDHVGDVITVMLTPEPLPGLPVGRSALKLTKEQVESWQKAWASPLKRIELAGGAGKLYTAEEQQAGQTGSRLLTQEEPVPQTMYRVEAKPGAPLVVAVPLGITRKRDQ